MQEVTDITGTFEIHIHTENCFYFKIWCLCSSNGYLYKFLPYDGERVDKGFQLPLSEHTIITELLSVVGNAENHRIVFDYVFLLINR